MDQYANCGAILTNVYNLRNHEFQRSIRNELQYKTKQDLLQISKNNSNDTFVI